MHVKILHHLFGIVGGDAIKAPLWDVAALGPTAFPNNNAFVHSHVSTLLTTSFPNMLPQQVEVSHPAWTLQRAQPCGRWQLCSKMQYQTRDCTLTSLCTQHPALSHKQGRFWQYRPCMENQPAD